MDVCQFQPCRNAHLHPFYFSFIPDVSSDEYSFLRQNNFEGMKNLPFLQPVISAQAPIFFHKCQGFFFLLSAASVRAALLI